MPTCETPLEYTTAKEPGVALETLTIDGGYWRTTTENDNILACYNADAYNGGQTGADSFCASGYTGSCERRGFPNPRARYCNILNHHKLSIVVY